jgi:hypothetical protein
MNKELGVVIALLEIASGAALLFLLGQPGLPPSFGLVLVFCLPITFGLHVFEEFIFPGGGADWFRRDRPQFAQVLTDSYFFNINAIPLVLSLLVTLGTFDFAGGFAYFGIRAWLAFLCFQAIHIIYSHIRGVFNTEQYSPGLATSILLYVPLTVTAFVYLLQTGVVDVVSALACIAVGFLILILLDHIKMSKSRVAA